MTSTVKNTAQIVQTANNQPVDTKAFQNGPKLDFILLLPPELSLLIPTFLPSKAVTKMAWVSRPWKEIANDNCYWKSIFTTYAHHINPVYARKIGKTFPDIKNSSQLLRAGVLTFEEDLEGALKEFGELIDSFSKNREYIFPTIDETKITRSLTQVFDANDAHTLRPEKNINALHENVLLATRTYNSLPGSGSRAFTNEFLKKKKLVNTLATTFNPQRDLSYKVMDEVYVEQDMEVRVRAYSLLTQFYLNLAVRQGDYKTVLSIFEHINKEKNHEIHIDFSEALEFTADASSTKLIRFLLNNIPDYKEYSPERLNLLTKTAILMGDVILLNELFNHPSFSQVGSFVVSLEEIDGATFEKRSVLKTFKVFVEKINEIDPVGAWGTIDMLTAIFAYANAPKNYRQMRYLGKQLILKDNQPPLTIQVRDFYTNIPRLNYSPEIIKEEVSFLNEQCAPLSKRDLNNFFWRTAQRNNKKCLEAISGLRNLKDAIKAKVVDPSYMKKLSNLKYLEGLRWLREHVTEETDQKLCTVVSSHIKDLTK